MKIVVFAGGVGSRLWPLSRKNTPKQFEKIIGEPVMRDVGPAVGLMTGILNKISPNEPMAILWSDHLVKREEHFRKILLTAGEIVENDPNKIVFVGQQPRFASENLGWIDYGKKIFD